MKCPHCKSINCEFKAGLPGEVLEKPHWKCDDCKTNFINNKSVPDILEDMVNTFRERDKVYGESYKITGQVMKVLFPDGIKLSSADEFNKFSIFNLIIDKISRFAPSMNHTDSIHDIAIYCAILESMMWKETK